MIKSNENQEKFGTSTVYKEIYDKRYSMWID